ARTLRPGSPIVLETINPACWLAFFSSYIRDLTHVRPVHPDTLQYLLRASGFDRVAVRYSAPVPDHMKMQTIDLPAAVVAGADPTAAALSRVAHAVNANAVIRNNLMVAHDESEIHELEALKKRGEGNGVRSLAIVGRGFIVEREPAVNASVALWSPDSGIVNAEEYVKALLRTGGDAGVIFLPGTKVVGAERRGDGMVLTTERETILAAVVVNAAGLYADDVSRLLGGEAFTIYPCRGEYAEFTPVKRSLVRALVY